MNIPATLCSTLGTLVNGHVYPLVAPQNAPTPRITYQDIASRHPMTLNQRPGIGRYRYQVDIWSASFGQAYELAQQAREALLTAFPKAGEITGNPSDFELDTRLFRQSFDVAIWQ